MNKLRFKNRRFKKNSDGLTLVEIIVSMALFAIIGTMFITTTSAAIKINADTQRWNMEIDNQENDVELHQTDNATQTPSVIIADMVFKPSTNSTTTDVHLGYHRYDTDEGTVMDDPTQFKYFMPKETSVEKGIFKVIFKNVEETSKNIEFSDHFGSHITWLTGDVSTVDQENIINSAVSSQGFTAVPADANIAYWFDYSDIIDDLKSKLGTPDAAMDWITLEVYSGENVVVTLPVSTLENPELIKGIIWVSNGVDDEGNKTLIVEYE